MRKSGYGTDIFLKVPLDLISMHEYSDAWLLICSEFPKILY